MIGILVQLALSWILLWLIDKKDLNALGVKPTSARLKDFGFGFFVSAIVLSVYCLTTAFLSNNHFSVNGSFSAVDFLSSAWWTASSVIFEELIFRGALLYFLIQKINERTGCFVSAVAFGVYHWFSYGVLGNPVQMAYVFILTGVWGLMFAYAYAKTRSLYLPTGLHLGWNLFNIVIFSRGPLEDQFLIGTTDGEPLSALSSIGLQLFQLAALPVIVYVYLGKSSKQVTSNR